MDQLLVPVEIVKMIDPGIYVVKPNSGSAAFASFEQFSEFLNARLNNDTFAREAVTPVIGRCYVGKEIDKWYRVRVDEIVQRNAGPHASCYLLDYGQERKMIPLRWIREAKEFINDKCPLQVRECYLNGIHPISLQFDRELNVKNRPASKWVESSMNFMKEKLTNCSQWKAMFLKEENKRIGIKLYAEEDANNVCINDLLVEKEFAAYDVADVSLKLSPQSSINDGVKLDSYSPEKSLGIASCRKPHSMVTCHERTTDVPVSMSICLTPSPPVSPPIGASQQSSSMASVGRGRLMKSMLTAKPTPLVGLKSSASVERVDAGRTRSPFSQTDSGRTSGSDLEIQQREEVSSTSSVLKQSKTLTVKSRLPTHVKSNFKNSIICTTSSHDFIMPNSNWSSETLEKSETRFSDADISYKRSEDVDAKRAKSDQDKMQSDPESTVTRSSKVNGKTMKFDADETRSLMNSNNIAENGSIDKIFISSGVRELSQQMMTADEMEILVEGPWIKYVIDVNNLPFSGLLQNTSQLINIRHLTKLQSFMFPSIQRGLDVIGIAPSNDVTDPTHGGKTTSYLLPLITLLNFKASYQSLPKFSISPFALVLCPSWESVLRTYDLCKAILNQQRYLRNQQVELRVHLLYGGGGDENQEINMINGCEILISTPLSLLRMMDKQVTNLQRLSHLVLEDADILLQQFKQEVDQIVGQFKLEIKDREGLSIRPPQQVLVFSEKWTSALKEFSFENQVSPIVVIVSKMESAHYGRVKEKPIVCRKRKRYGRILELLASKRKKVAIFTSNCQAAKEIYDVVRTSSIYVLLAHDEMDSSELNKVTQDWNSLHQDNSQPVLVVTDGVLSVLNLSDVCWTIHYDIPTVLESFANRTWCMRRYFAKYDDIKECALDECVSFLLITEDCQEVSSNLIKLLQRCGEEIPVEMVTMSEEYMEIKERGKLSQLCHNFKSFGFCRYQNRCKSRHKLFASLDSPGVSPRHMVLPSEGTVKVLVTHVIDASCFYVQLLDLVDSKGQITHFSRSLSMEIAHHFAKPSSTEHPAVSAEESQLFAWQDVQHVFQRVEVVEVWSSDPLQYPDMAKVFQVDTGRTLVTPIGELFPLPDHLAKIPYQGVEVFVCRIQPVDKDFSWTDKANLHLDTMIRGQTLEGNIVLSFGNSLWLDPVEKREWFPNLKVFSTLFTVRPSLLDIKYAKENPEHLRLLYKACEGILQPSYLKFTNRAWTASGTIVSTKAEEFPDDFKGYHDVYVTAVNSPDLVYVQLSANVKRLEELHEDIKGHMNRTQEQTEFTASEKLLVLVKTSDNCWNRGIVQQVTDSQYLEVFLVDSGVTDDVPLSDVAPMPMHFNSQLPFQAIECSLIDLEPVGSAYYERCADVLLALTADSNDVSMVVPVLVHKTRTSKAHYIGKHHYVVSMYNLDSYHYHMNIGSHLVVMNLVKLSSHKLKELYPAADDDDINRPIHKVSCLCKAILRTKEKEVQSENGLELHKLTLDLCLRKADRSGLVSVVGQTLEFCWQVEAARPLLSSLKLLAADNPSHCAELEISRTWDVLCHIFAKHESNLLLEEVLSVLESLLNCQRCCEMFATCGGLFYLGAFLCSSQVDVVTLCMISLIDRILQNTTSYGLNVACLECFKGTISQMTSLNWEIVRSCLNVFDFLLQSDSHYLEEARRLGGIKAVCENLETWLEKDEQLVVKGIKILTMAADGGRFNKDVMIQLDAPSILEKIGQSPELDSDTRRLSIGLSKTLHLLIPSDDHVRDGELDKIHRVKSKRQFRKQLITNQPIPRDQLARVTMSRRPEVAWTQSKWDILLNVNVKDAISSTDFATFAVDSVSFRAVAMSTEYTFSFSLYELIVPEKCETAVRAGCVYVGLKKKLKGIWPRLTRDKKMKYPGLNVDFNRYEELSESDSSDEDLADDGKHLNDEDDVKNGGSPLDLIFKQSTRPLFQPITQLTSDYPDGTPDIPNVPNDSEGSDDEIESDVDLEFDPTLQEDKELGFYPQDF